MKKIRRMRRNFVGAGIGVFISIASLTACGSNENKNTWERKDYVVTVTNNVNFTQEEKQIEEIAVKLINDDSPLATTYSMNTLLSEFTKAGYDYTTVANVIRKLNIDWTYIASEYAFDYRIIKTAKYSETKEKLKELGFTSEEITKALRNAYDL